MKVLERGIRRLSHALSWLVMVTLTVMMVFITVSVLPSYNFTDTLCLISVETMARLASSIHNHDSALNHFLIRSAVRRRTGIFWHFYYAGTKS